MARRLFATVASLIWPLSRTFIPSRLDDNPYLAETGYGAQLLVEEIFIHLLAEPVEADESDANGNPPTGFHVVPSLMPLVVKMEASGHRRYLGSVCLQEPDLTDAKVVARRCLRSRNTASATIAGKHRDQCPWYAAAYNRGGEYPFPRHPASGHYQQPVGRRRSDRRCHVFFSVVALL